MDYKLQLVTQSPINFEGLKIYQPIFREIEEDIESYNQLLIPYSLTFDLLNIPEESTEDLKYFDIICFDQSLKNLFIKSLQYFCKTDNINFYKNSCIVDKCIIHRDNFDDFSKIILDINAREKPKVEKTPIFKNERQKDIWEKLQEGRKRFAKKSELYLYDVLNICEFYDYYIPMKTIKEWTLFKIMQCYKVKIGVSNWKDTFSIYLVSGEKSLIEGKHWTDLIKLDYTSQE